MALCSVLTASPAGGHTAHFFSSTPLTANGTFEPLTHVLPPLCHPAQEPSAVKTGCSADTPCHFEPLWESQQLSTSGSSWVRRKGWALQVDLLHKSHPSWEGSPVNAQHSPCPLTAEALVPSTRVSKFQQDFLMHLFLCPVLSFSVRSGLPGESAASSPPPPVAGQLCASALGLAGGSQPAEESPPWKARPWRTSSLRVCQRCCLPSLSCVKTYLFNQPLVSQGKPCKFPPPRASPLF